MRLRKIKQEVNVMLSLDKTTENTLYRVVSIDLPEGIRKRLAELGLIKGTLVSKVLVAPSGDPSAYFIRGAQIALRSDFAAAITVERVTS